MWVLAVRWPASIAILALCSTRGWSTQPSLAAVQAYDRVVGAIEQQAENGSTGMAQLACPATSANGVFVQRLPIQDSAGRAVRSDGALIHHWHAAMFIPDVRPEEVASTLRDYDHHSLMYAPEVTYSKLIDRDDMRYHVLHVTLTRSVLVVGLQIESLVDWHEEKQERFWSHSRTVRVTELEHAGTPRARPRSPAEAKGWLWAIDSWWHVAGEGRGSCITYETLALTRDYPRGWGCLLRPIAEHFPAETLTNMLRRTRAAVQSREQGQQVSARASTMAPSCIGVAGQRR